VSGDIQYLAEMCGGDCRWFLVGLTDGEMTHYDGCWSSAEDVGKALYLRNQLHIGPQPDQWAAVYIGEVEPIRDDDINRESVQACNEMLAARLRQT